MSSFPVTSVISSPLFHTVSSTNAVVKSVLRHLFPFVNIARPIVLEQARQRPIGQDFAPCLAARAVVGFVVGVHDALHRRAAHGVRPKFAELAAAASAGMSLRERLWRCR